MKTTRKENEFVLTPYDIIYSFPFWAILFFVAFMSAHMFQNYFFASLFCFAFAKYFGNEDVRFGRNKLSKFLLKEYAYTLKLIIAAMLAIAIILSWVSLKAFICSIFFSIIWKEYMKAFAKRKSLN